MKDAVETLLGETRATATQRVLHRLRGYVEQETPSGAGAACTALVRQIAVEAEALGGTIKELDAGPMGINLRAEFGAVREPAAPHLLVLGHIDTVHPKGTLARQPFQVADERATGPGIYDMKAGVALMIGALALLRRTGRVPQRRVVLLITCDEEVGSATSRPHIEAEAAGAAAVLVPEPSLSGGRAKTSRKGVATYQLTAHGRAAHAGVEPEKGVNAIVELAHQLTRLPELTDADGTTVSVGTMQGGTATNVIPALATAAIDVRFPNAAADQRVRAALQNLEPRLPGARLELEQTDWRPPLVRNEGVVALYRRARELANELGFELGEGGTGGGSDGCLTAALGIPTLDGLGPQGGGAHSVDEHVLVADLPFRLAFFSLLLEQL
jgi:glutamate carboxypeptidase